jgi:hypothetical protein
MDVSICDIGEGEACERGRGAMKVLGEVEGRSLLVTGEGMREVRTGEGGDGAGEIGGEKAERPAEVRRSYRSDRMARPSEERRFRPIETS